MLPRHLGIIGTTGSGKSTSVAGLVHRLQRAGVATILIDVEGEYTEIDLPATDQQMLTALRQRRLAPDGTRNLHILHLIGRETSREARGAIAKPFCLQFADLSPYAVMEILDLSPAQQERFLKAYDTLKLVMRDLEIFPKPGEENLALEVDELDGGYPRMTLLQLIDVAGVFADMAASSRDERTKSKSHESEEGMRASELRSPELRGKDRIIRQRAAAAQAPGNVVSWRGLLGKLWRVQRLQEENFNRAQAAGKRPTPVVIIIEEAHEFLSAQRIHQMPVLFQQVARIAKRGRKRWLGLVFVTQLPQHLPDEVLGLINNFIIYKIADGTVVDRLRKSISGIDRGQWGMLPGLAPGQALVSLTHMTRPLLVSVDPAPCQLKLSE